MAPRPDPTGLRAEEPCRAGRCYSPLTSQPGDARGPLGASHLEIKGFITVEDQHEASELMAKGFDRLGLPCPRRSCY